MRRAFTRRITATMCSMALLGGGAVATAQASDPPGSATDDSITIDLGAQLDAAAAQAIVDMPVLDLDDVGPVDEDGATFSVSLPAGKYSLDTGRVQTFAAAASWKCTAKAHNPHFSNGNGGVIGKATVNCTGSNGTLPIQASLILGKNNVNSTKGMWFEKQSTYTQNVVANMGDKTWYVPELGKAGAVRGGYFRTSVGAAAMPPIQATNIASHASAIVAVN